MVSRGRAARVMIAWTSGTEAVVREVDDGMRFVRWIAGPRMQVVISLNILQLGNSGEAMYRGGQDLGFLLAKIVLRGIADVCWCLNGRREVVWGDSRGGRRFWRSRTRRRRRWRRSEREMP